MSYEFGNYVGGYFHNKIYSAKEDLEQEAKFELHKRLIPFFGMLHEVSFAISAVEAGDSGEDRSVFAMLDNLPLMISELEKLDAELEIFRRVAREAVQRQLETF
jgi:hypothetical protein